MRACYRTLGPNAWAATRHAPRLPPASALRRLHRPLATAPRRQWRRRRPAAPTPPRDYDSEVQLTAQVERITFHRAENGWSVVRARVEGEQALVTLAGTMHGVRAGQLLEVTGRWGVHSAYGEQLAVATCTPLALERMATSSAAVAAFLAKTVDGVGPKTATKIVEHFGSGEATLDVLAAQPSRLTEVSGVSPRLADNIRAAWARDGERQEQRAALAGLEVPAGEPTERLLERWGARAPAIVTAQPYRITTEAGLRFAVADRVAACEATEWAGGIHAPERYAAASLHALREAVGRGHCCLPAAAWVSATAAVLDRPSLGPRSLTEEEIDRDAIETGWATLLDQKAVARETFAPPALGSGTEPEPEPEELWYTARLHAIERDVATLLAKLMADPDAWPEDEAERAAMELEVAATEKCVADVVQQQQAELTAEQLAAVRAAVDPRGRGAIITGGPGCGKTFIMRVVVEVLRAQGQVVALAAPTGRAAQRLSELVGAETPGEQGGADEQAEATTIHRLLEYRGGTGDGEYSGFARGPSNPIPADAVLVDEASMLDISLARDLLAALGPQTRLVLIGDPDQLPSIGAGNVLRDALASGVLRSRLLSTVFRQAARSSIIASAHAVNRGAFPSRDEMHLLQADEFVSVCRAAAAAGRAGKRSTDAIDFCRHKRIGVPTDEGGDAGREQRRARLRDLLGGKDCVFVESDSPEMAADVVESALLTLTPSMGYSPTEDAQLLTPGNKGALGGGALNARLRPLLNPRYRAAANPEDDPESRLKLGWGVGDKVIQVVNNYDHEVYNGDIGFVTALEPRSRHNRAPSATVEFVLGRRRRSVEYRGLGELRQLLPAWAITVHKSQGSEYPIVVVPLTTQHWFVSSRNLIYTALTRARQLCLVVGERKAMHAALGKTDGSDRSTGLTQRLLKEAE